MSAYLNDVWQKIRVEVWPVNASDVHNHFYKLVSNVPW